MAAKTLILDTDIGYDPDDFFALLLALKSPEVDIALIVTADETEKRRAAFLSMVLDVAGKDIPVVCGTDLGNTKHFIVDRLLDGRTFGGGEDYVESMKRVADSTDLVTYVGIGGFTNIATFFKRYPDYKNKFELYMMGGAIHYDRGDQWVEHNVRIDKESARYVLELGVTLSLVMAQTTFQEEYEINEGSAIFKRLKESSSPLHQLLAHHIELFHENVHGFWPRMHDPLTLATAMGKDFVTFHKAGIRMDEIGRMTLEESTSSVAWSDPVSQKKEFMKFLEERLFD